MDLKDYKSVTVKFCGGVGNQLFQYAFSRFLSQSTGCKVLYDLSWYFIPHFRSTPRRFSLDCLGVKHTSLSVSSILSPLSAHLAPLLGKNLLFEKRILDSPDILNALQDGSVFIGYWQSYRYFEEEKSVILRHLFDLRENFSNSLGLNASSLCMSVALHVRRGDYVTNKHANSFHGVLDSYYEHAVRLMSERIDGATFYVFSDDITWCKEKFAGFDHAFVYVQQNLKDPIQDLLFMSLMGHNIIANSSFSWWGAYLNSNRDKFVIYPELWFKGREQPVGLIPHGWIPVR